VAARATAADAAGAAASGHHVDRLDAGRNNELLLPARVIKCLMVRKPFAGKIGRRQSATKGAVVRTTPAACEHYRNCANAERAAKL
jgi:hypothetical protein